MKITKEILDNEMSKLSQSYNEDLDNAHIEEMKETQKIIAKSDFYKAKIRVYHSLALLDPIRAIHGSIITSFYAGLKIGYELGQNKALEEMFKES
jgi:hypothetical protein